MPSFTTILNSVLLIDKPWTSALSIAIRDNPIAIAEGAASAPRVQGRALGGVSLGGRDMDGADATYTGLAGCGVVVSPLVSQAGIMQVRYSSNNGSSYGSWQALITMPATGSGGAPVYNGTIRLNLQTGAYFAAACGVSSAGAAVMADGSGTHTVPSGCNAFEIQYSDGGPGFVDFLSLGGLE